MHHLPENLVSSKEKREKQCELFCDLLKLTRVISQNMTVGAGNPEVNLIDLS